MSDFYRSLSRKKHQLLVAAMSLDFAMWRIKEDRPKFPFDLGPEALTKRHCAELVQRIYFEGKPPPRYPAGEPEDFYSDLRESVGSVKEIAKRLGVSRRDVRRKLNLLRQQRRIPSQWFDGYQWKPPVEAAIIAIKGSATKFHALHTRESHDSFASYVMQCHKEAARFARELKEIEAICETCERWRGLLVSNIPAQGLSADDLNQHLTHARQRAYETLARLAEKTKWSFCSLFVATYEAVQNRSRPPVEAAKNSIGLKHASFYRAYAPRDVEEARRLAEGAFTNPDWFGYRPQMLSNDEAAAAFSDWNNKVSEKDLWVDVG